MDIPFVDLKSQYDGIKAEIDDAVSQVISKTAFIGGPWVKSFETDFATFCQAGNCIGVANGTDALFLSLKALGIGKDDEVITAANSFIATSEAITMTGASVVFVDINPQTYNIDVALIEGKITDRTRAIIPVHLYGQPADMDPILEIAGKYGLKIVEDAAQAHGALYKGRRIGSIGDLASFSFYPGKNLGAYGDAGAIVTDDDVLAQKIIMIANHGRADKYYHAVEGVNSRLDGLQAAVLGVKLKHLPQWSERRRRNARLYSEFLRDTGCVTPVEIEDVESVYHLYVVRVKSEARQGLQDHLKFRGISTGIHYPIALPNLRAYEYLNHGPDEFPEATKASGEILSLPMFPELDEGKIRYICDAIREFN
ncbi:DegT/DnrJ/EryC1/StrS family aminotransferase [Thermodesulfobacteriota bacterium]